MQQLTVPDIGDYREIPVIDVLIRAGDVVGREQTLITLESDKATMDVPSAFSGTIREVLLKPGDTVSHGTLIAHIEAENGVEAPVSVPHMPEARAMAEAVKIDDPARIAAVVGSPPQSSDKRPHAASLPVNDQPRSGSIAGPSVRKLARELGIDLSVVVPRGPKGRVLREDVLAHTKATLAHAPGAAEASRETGIQSGGGLDLLPWPQVDFAKFGVVERHALSRLKRMSGANLHRNWVHIPHVTNFDQADVTDLEAFRRSLNSEVREGASRVTLLAFLIKACVAALQRFPQFNVSLDGHEVVLKHYFHIGFAADTPGGLVVPVIRDADRKGITAIAAEMAELATAARAGKLAPAQMQGGCMSISSLGGIGGSHFTPIINAPEVAILGVGKGAMQPVWDGAAFQPRLILPLSLSWDHRAVDGAEAGRFLAYLATLVSDFRRVLL